MENNSKEIKVENQIKNTNKDNIEIDKGKAKDKKKNSNKIFVIAIITAFLIFLTYVFISQFISNKEKKDINSRIELEQNVV